MKTGPAPLTRQFAKVFSATHKSLAASLAGTNHSWPLPTTSFFSAAGFAAADNSGITDLIALCGNTMRSTGKDRTAAEAAKWFQMVGRGADSLR
jgi:hypothetical protein